MASAAPRHNSWLDWLRFLASLEVVLTHARTMLFVEYAQLDNRNAAILVWSLLTRMGYEAVMVFFVLSGFLVGGRALEQALNGRFTLSAYVIDRTVRIMVPLTATIALTVALALIMGWPMTLAEIVGNWLGVQGAFVPVMRSNYPLWTLSYEVWFYIGGGAIACLIGTKYRIMPVLALLAAAVIFTRLNALYALLWIGGAISYRYRPRTFRWQPLFVGVAFTLVGIAVFQIAAPNAGSPAGSPLGQVAGGGLLGFGMCCLIPVLYVAPWEGRAARLGTFLASFSYSLYLTHMPLIELVPVHDSRSVNAWTLGAYVGTVALCLVVAFFFSRLFETTAPALKQRLKAWWTARAGSPASTPA